MPFPDDSWLPDWALAVAEKILAAMGFVAAGVTGILYRRYRDDRAMLLRHEELLRNREEELGNLKVFRLETNKGPTGEALAQDIRELKREDRRLRKGIGGVMAKIKVADERLGRIETNIEWIKEAIDRMEDK